MIRHRIFGSHNHSADFNLTNATNDGFNHDYTIYHNKDRTKHIILLVIAILMCKCCAVTADSTGECFDFVYVVAMFFFVCVFQT